MSVGRPTYGELVRVAARHANWASLGLVTERIADRATAEASLIAYRETFAAVRVHIERLVGGPRRIEGMRWSDWTSPSDRAALRLVEQLSRIRPPAEPAPRIQAQPVGSWYAASRALGAAGDLLASHTNTNGSPRTPDAAAWSEGAVRAVGYAQLADLTSVLCSADRDLALRCGQAGVPWRAVARALPALDCVADGAHELHQAARQELGFAATTDTLDAITVARPTIRTYDPLLELDDRTARLRLGAWTLANHPQRGSVFDLAEYAAAAVVLHTHLSAYADPLGAGPYGRDALEADREGWARVTRLLSRLGSAANLTSGVRAEVHALANAAQLVLPLVRDESGVHAAGPARDCVPMARDWVGVCQSIATSSRSALAAQADRGMLYLHARHLDGDRVTDSPALVSAKIAGRYVPAAEQDVAPVLEAYTAREANAPRRTDPHERSASERSRRIDSPSR